PQGVLDVQGSRAGQVCRPAHGRRATPVDPRSSGTLSAGRRGVLRPAPVLGTALARVSPMKLADLVVALDAQLADTPDHLRGTEVTGVSHQAAWIRPGDLFVAVRGARFDGHGFM